MKASQMIAMLEKNPKLINRFKNKRTGNTLGGTYTIDYLIEQEMDGGISLRIPPMSSNPWLQDPDEWKITCTPARKKKKTILQKLEPWLITIGFVAFVMLCDWLIETLL